MLAACGDDGSSAANDSGPGDDATATADVASPVCLFDEDLAGKNVGNHVENIKLKDSEGEKFELHNQCGVAKAIWIILATGW